MFAYASVGCSEVNYAAVQNFEAKELFVMLLGG
jgi:hypothetical protein